MGRRFLYSLAVFILSLAPSQLLACERFLLGFIEGTNEACTNYVEGDCGRNTLAVVDAIQDRLGRQSLATAKVLIIYNREFQKLYPSHVISPGVSWLYHVILQTELGVIDLDSKDFHDRDFQPIPFEEYLSQLFPGELQNSSSPLNVIAVPAMDYFDQRPHFGEPTRYYALAETPKGLILRLFQRKLMEKQDGFYLPLRSGEAPFYLLSAEARLTHKSVPLGDYLAAQKRQLDTP